MGSRDHSDFAPKDTGHDPLSEHQRRNIRAATASPKDLRTSTVKMENRFSDRPASGEILLSTPTQKFPSGSRSPSVKDKNHQLLTKTRLPPTPKKSFFSETTKKPGLVQHAEPTHGTQTSTAPKQGSPKFFTAMEDRTSTLAESVFSTPYDADFLFGRTSFLEVNVSPYVYEPW